ncbi:Uncharacterized protein OBRU01_09735, partial [Operophtera brumata]
EVYILDTPDSGVYVWLGSGVDAGVKKNYHDLANQYLALKGYPAWVNVTRVTESAESATFKQYFHDWDTSPATIRALLTETDAGYYSGDAEEAAASAKLIGKSAAARGVSGEQEDITESVLSGLPVIYQSEVYVITYRFSDDSGADSCVLYWWIGAGAPQHDKLAALQLVTRLEDELGERVTVVPERAGVLEDDDVFVLETAATGDEPDEFWEALGGASEEKEDPSAWKLAVNRRVTTPHTLTAVTVKVTGKIRFEDLDADYSQQDLSDDGVYILDTGEELYLWQGSNIPEREYIEDDGLDRSAETALVVSVRQGAEPAVFKKLFPQWDEDMWEDDGLDRSAKTALVVSVRQGAEPAVFKKLFPQWDEDMWEDDGLDRSAKTALVVSVRQGAEPAVFKKLFPQWDEDMWEDDGLDRSAKTALVVSVRQGAEPAVFKKLFPQWDEDMWEVSVHRG